MPRRGMMLTAAVSAVAAVAVAVENDEQRHNSRPSLLEFLLDALYYLLSF